jgi:hypothetical protein
MFLWRDRIRSKPGWWAMALGSTIQFMVLWVMIGKHPGTNYLVSVAALLPILFLLAFIPFLRQENRISLIPLILGTLLLTVFVFSLVVAVNDQRNWLRQIKAGELAIGEFMDHYLEKKVRTYPSLTVLWGYGVPSRCYALRYGNISTERAAFNEEINQICPNEWIYDVWGDYVELPTAYEPLAENDDWDIVILPEVFIPEGIEASAHIHYTQVETRDYGRISILEAARSK